MRRVGALTLSVVVMTALTACGTSGKSSTSSGGGGPTQSQTSAATTNAAAPTSAAATTSSAAAATSGGSPAGVSQALSFTGGHAGAASPTKSPITIGFVGQQGGNPSYPEEIVTGQAAVKYINDNLGGVDGHPIKLDTCNITSTEEQAQTCAQQFINDHALPMVVSGGIDIGSQSFFQTLNGQVPFIEGDAGSAADAVAKNTVILSSGVLEVPAAIAAYSEKYYHPKTVAIIGPDVPIVQLADTLQAKIFQKDGAKVTTSTFPPTSTDLIAPLTAVNAKDADVLVSYGLTPNCPAIARTLTQLGRTKPVIGLGLCIDPTVKAALGDYPKWGIIFPNQNPYFPQGSPNVASYLAGLHQYAGPKANIAGFAGFTWTSMLTAVRVMNKLGAANISAQSVGKALKGLTAPSFMSPPLKCGSIPAAPALCNTTNYINVYNGNGKWTDLTHGQGVTASS